MKHGRPSLRWGGAGHALLRDKESAVKIRRNSHYGYSPNAYPSASAKRFSGKCRRRGGAGATKPPGSREAF